MDPYGALIKWGGLAVGVLALCGVIFYQGMAFTQTRWDAAVAQQQMAAGENIVKNARNTAAIESQYQRTIDAQAKRVRQLTKEVKAYADSPTNKCELSPEFVTVFDALSRLHESAADSLPSAADSAGAAAVLPEAPVTDAAILEVHQLTTVELANLWDTYAALRDWVRTSHDIAEEGAGR
jgi:hypothetical protein